MTARAPTVSVNPEPFFFTKADWGVTHDGRVPTQPPPGSWYDIDTSPAKHIFRSRGATALYCCPKCKGVRALHVKYHRITQDGKATTTIGANIECGVGCDFRRECYLLKWSNKTLWGVAIERFIGDSYVPYMRYTNAKTEAEARKQFVMRPKDRIVACAPVIGYYVEDKVGNLLNVD